MANEYNERRQNAWRDYIEDCNAVGIDYRDACGHAFKAGYDAHESAIRSAAEALVGVMEKLFNNEDGIIYGEDDIKAEFDALKAALAKEKE